MNEEKTHNNVPADIAKQMVDAYAKEAGDKPSYTKAVWFPADQILNIAKTLQDGKHDGLRIYIGQYTADSLDGVPENYLGRNTLLLVPTLSTYAKGETNTDEHEDDLTDIENKGTTCPTACEGTGL